MTASTQKEELLSAEAVTLHYKGLGRAALQEVTVRVERGTTLGVVGESGSGKSSLARCLVGMERLTSGRICYRGEDIHAMSRAGLVGFRRKVQMVFQDPFNSLNPRKTLGDAMNEVLRVHRITKTSPVELLERVGLTAAMAERYPHELSGGQRQRAGIARALAVDPEIIIADEPVSALDVSVQAHLLNVLKELIKTTGVTLVMIAHDLAVVRNVCEKIVVMSEGRIVEEGDAAGIIAAPRHPYTQALIAAVPDWQTA